MSWCLSANLLESISFDNIENDKYQINNSISGSTRRAYPEEIIRQLMYSRLVKEYLFNPDVIHIEFPIQIGSSKKRADIVVIDKDKKPLIVVEVKVLINTEAIGQLHSYLYASQAKYGVLVDSQKSFYYEKLSDNTIMEVSELKSFNSETKNVDSSKMSLPEQKTTFGINHLVKEICEGNETWMVESGDIAFKVSLESLQNYSSIQKMALELGHSLLNHNPSQKEWRLALHHLIQSPRIIKKKSEFRLIKEYTFFIDVADMILENNLNSSNYFFTRKNGLFSCLLNKVYTEYESYKIKKNAPPL